MANQPRSRHRIASKTAAAVLLAVMLACVVPTPTLAQEGVQVEQLRVDIRLENDVAVTRTSLELANSGAGRETGVLLPMSASAVLTNVTLATHNRTMYGVVWQKAAAQASYESAKASDKNALLIRSIDRGRLDLLVFVPTESRLWINATYVEVVPLFENVLSYRFPLSKLGAGLGPADEFRLQANIVSSTPWKRISSSGLAEPIEASNQSAAVDYAAKDFVSTEDWGLVVEPAAAGYASRAAVSQRGGNMTLVANLIPPSASGASLPLDVVFVLDRSGSMSGTKIVQARNALIGILGQLRAEDRLGLVGFADHVTAYQSSMQSASATNKDAAREWVSRVQEGGSTNLEGGLAHAFQLLGSGERAAVPTVVLITDGLPTAGIIDHREIFDAVASKNTARARLHVVGIGFDQDNDFLAGLATAHRGFYEPVMVDAEVETRLSDFYQRIRAPVLKDVAVQFIGLAVQDVHPHPLPDLYQGSSLVLAGRVNESSLPSGIQVRITGRDASGLVSMLLPLSLDDSPVVAEADRVWARLKANSLEQQYAFSSDPAESARLRAEILLLGLRFQLATQETSWLVADSVQAAELADQALRAPVRSGFQVGTGTGAGTGAPTIGGITNTFVGGGGGVAPDAEATPSLETPGFAWVGLLVAVAIVVGVRRKA